MNRLPYATAVAAGFAFALQVHAQQVPSGVVLFDINKAQWEKSATGEAAKIVGDQTKPGPYIFLTKPRAAPSPANKPHTHPDTRTYTVISGTWYVGFGEKFDESKLIQLKAGSVYTEPAGVPHFVVVKDEGTIVQISGTGPSRQIFVGDAK
jgi:quercetin dioxygenase-like cupin family protein